MPFEDERWRQRFFEYLRKKAKGYTAWEDLAFGTNAALVILIADHVAADTLGDIEVNRRNRKAFAENLKTGVPKVLATAEMIRDLQRQTSNYRIPVGQFADLPEQLTAYAKELQVFAQIALKNTSDRLPKSSDYLLFFLHSYLLEATGKPQWRCLATVLEAANAAYGREVEIDDDSLRKKITGMTTRDSRTCSHIEQRAKEYFESGNGNWWTRKEWDQIICQLAEELAIEPYRKFVEDHPADEGARAFLESIERESESKRLK